MLLLWGSQHRRVDARLFLGSVRSAAASPTADGAAAALAQAELVPCALQALSVGAGPVEVTPEGRLSSFVPVYMYNCLVAARLLLWLAPLSRVPHQVYHEQSCVAWCCEKPCFLCLHWRARHT
jgi:hypothetical protein